jgi:hypothetical protein
MVKPALNDRYEESEVGNDVTERAGCQPETKQIASNEDPDN